MTTNPPEVPDEVVTTATRPGNLVRNLFHVANAATVIGLATLVLPTDELRLAVAAAGAALAWTLEGLRRASPRLNDVLMGWFAKVAHPHEAVRTNSATWYATSVVLLAAFAPLDIGIAALAVLGLGDPAAAVVGRRIGRVPVGRGRTLEGSLAFAVVGAGAAFGVTAWLFPAPLATVALRAAVAGVTGAIAEVTTRRLDDNLTIPLAVAIVLGLLRLVGI